jgi:hypothetical protein
MMIVRKYFEGILAVAYLASGLVMAFAQRPAVAGDLSAEQILDGLKTRGLSTTART